MSHINTKLWLSQHLYQETQHVKCRVAFGLINTAASWIRVIHKSLTAPQFIEVYCILWRQKICYILYKPINGPIVLQTNPNHMLTTSFLTVHCNIILPITERCIQNNILFLVFMTEKFCYRQIQTTWL